MISPSKAVNPKPLRPKILKAPSPKRILKGTTEQTRAAAERQASRLLWVAVNQDPPCTLNWGYMVPNNGYLGLNRG